MPLPTPFPAARYRLEFTTERPIHLPEYAGSALRGAFGHALKHIACVTRERDCANCALYQGKAGDAAGACPLFAGKQVSAKGWCSAWAKKA